jgi:hypothetical protein
MTVPATLSRKPAWAFITETVPLNYLSKNYYVAVKSQSELRKKQFRIRGISSEVVVRLPERWRALL